MAISSRRTVLKQFGAAATAMAAPMFIPASALGRDGNVSPGERINMGLIGCGGRASDVIRSFLGEKDVQWRAVCDVRADRVRGFKQRVDSHYGATECATYGDFREMIARPDIDGVYIATGLHWHALLSIMAARAGKDVFSEKPVCLTVGEGRAICDTMKRYGTVYQAGHQRRSVDSFRFMAEVVRKGMIGKLERVIMQVWQNDVVGPSPVKPVPAGFDYDLWLGPTPWHPYTDGRVNGRSYFWDTGGGMAVDMGCHWTDIAQFVQQKDHTTPIRYEGTARYDRNAFSDNPIGGEWTATYADGVKAIMRQQGGFDERYIRFEGSEGWIQLVDATNAVTASPASILKARSINPKGWGDAGDHVRNFLDCIKARNPMTTCHPESAHRATTMGHLGNICWRLGRAIDFNPVTERIPNDPEADRLLSRALRAPWRL